MYLPSMFRGEPALGWQLARDESFGLLLFGDEVAPLPWLADEAAGTLRGHAAAANPAAALDGAAVRVVFSGPHGYVTPRWYGEPHAQVPTWNYVVAQAHGTIRRMSEDATRALLRETCARFEPAEGGYDPSWIEPALHDRLLRAIVGLEITVERMEAKLKLSQNRAPEDRRRVREGFAAAGADALAAWMERVAR